MEENKERKENPQAKSQATVEVIDFGPLKITGNFILKDLKRDKEETLTEVKLCICGRSANKPYCDDSHKK
jgi:CDGSH iron-sulfur domain-containing protein 3